MSERHEQARQAEADPLWPYFIQWSRGDIEAADPWEAFSHPEEWLFAWRAFRAGADAQEEQGEQ